MTTPFNEAVHSFLARATCASAVTAFALRTLTTPSISCFLKLLLLPLLAIAIYAMVSSVTAFAKSVVPVPSTPKPLKPLLESKGMQGLRDNLPAFLRELPSHKKYVITKIAIYAIVEIGMVWMFVMALAAIGFAH